MENIYTVGVVVIQDDTVLLVREGEKSSHVTGVYNTPAGRIDEGETPVQAAVRELHEESGLRTTEADLEQLPKIYEADIPRKDGTVRHFIHTAFACKRFEGELVATDETIPEWVPMSELNSYTLLPNIRDIIVEGKKVL
jgi:mutator protein MutT